MLIDALFVAHQYPLDVLNFILVGFVVVIDVAVIVAVVDVVVVVSEGIAIGTAIDHHD